jgi:hypothetical protein
MGESQARIWILEAIRRDELTVFGYELKRLLDVSALTGSATKVAWEESMPGNSKSFIRLLQLRFSKSDFFNSDKPSILL